jgi:hypothetical protein
MNVFLTFYFVPFPYDRLVCVGAICAPTGNEFCELPKARATGMRSTIMIHFSSEIKYLYGYNIFKGK